MEVRSVEAIVRALNDASVRYLIVGGLAVNAHGYERFTNDVDLVIGLERQNIIDGLYSLRRIGYETAVPVSPEDFADAQLRDTWRKEKGMVVLKLWSDTHRRTPIDVFIYEPFDFAREYAAATWENLLGTIKAPIISYEALVEMKRLAGRPRDIADLADLAEVQRLKKVES
jgi:predicted nucleotidyltransferase